MVLLKVAWPNAVSRFFPRHIPLVNLLSNVALPNVCLLTSCSFPKNDASSKLSRENGLVNSGEGEIVIGPSEHSHHM